MPAICQDMIRGCLRTDVHTATSRNKEAPHETVAGGNSLCSLPKAWNKASE
jgi:hypothetical protein